MNLPAGTKFNLLSERNIIIEENADFWESWKAGSSFNMVWKRLNFCWEKFSSEGANADVVGKRQASPVY
ncbi:MAG: hypothetical protein AB1796_11215 [Bacillota bacterium]